MPKVLDGKYELLQRIGAGGMGEVFRARYVPSDALCCIKVMRQALLAKQSLLTQIQHPNVAAVYEVFSGDGINYIVTELIDGSTIRQWMAAHGAFPLALAIDVASQILAGLEHIHQRGLLHRDISPDNVMLMHDADAHLIAKIIDLGIATRTETQSGVLLGNPKYMSPEQLGMLDEGERIDGRADLYALGLVLYEMLAGVPAYVSDTPQGYITKHLTQTPTRLANIPAALEHVIFRALEKDRRRRYADAREFADALAPFLKSPMNEEEQFQRAWENGGVAVWRAFIAQHPTSPRLARAKKLLDEALTFERIALRMRQADPHS
jgi:serine/threonine protein kinase